MTSPSRSRSDLELDLAAARAERDEARAAMQAILAGGADALVVPGPDGPQVFSRHSAEEPYRVLVEAINEGALMLVAGTIAYCNKRFAQIVDAPLDQVIGTAFERFVLPEQRPALSSLLAGAKTSPGRVAMNLVASGGAPVPTRISASVLDLDGAPSICLVVSDISDLRAQEQELREQQSYTRGLIESNIDALMTTDMLGVITDLNRQMAATTGCSREDLIGTPFKGYFTDPQRAEDGIRQVLAEDRVTNYELTIRARDGRETMVSSNATTFKSADGRVRGVFAAFRDITDQKRLEAQLRRQNDELQEQSRRVQEANRLKSEFLANMSHELRTPLNAIIAFSQLMHDERVGPVADHHREYLGDVLTSARHLLQLINDVLDLSKVESGKMDFRPEPIDLPRLVGEVRDILRSLAGAKRISIAIEVAPDLREIEADPAKLKQVLYNYLSNALKFTPDDGRVSVRIVPDGVERFRIEVEDSGIGIRAEDQALLFVAFQQLDASASKKYQGTGLGLALTRRFVEAQGGTVGMRSEPGRGSVFIAILPRRPVDLRQAPVPPAAGDVGEGHHGG